MTDLATYSRSGPVGTIVMDDGKANVMSLAMLNALHAAFDQAEKDKTVVILKARGKHFSGGFDLSVFAKGSAEDQYLMLKAGAELALRILSFPTPVVAACQGNAYPMGAFLIMSSDHRIAAEGDYRIGMNEVAIGLTVPRFAIEIARQRLTPAYFSRVVMTAEMFGPAKPSPPASSTVWSRPRRWSVARRRRPRRSPRSTWQPMPRPRRGRGVR